MRGFARITKAISREADFDREPTAKPQPSEKTARALRRANRTFEIIELVVPKRISAEEIGDAMETIAFLISQGRPSWQIYVKVVTTVLWVLIHSVHQVIKGPSRSPKKEG